MIKESNPATPRHWHRCKKCGAQIECSGATRYTIIDCPVFDDVCMECELRQEGIAPEGETDENPA